MARAGSPEEPARNYFELLACRCAADLLHLQIQPVPQGPCHEARAAIASRARIRPPDGSV